MWHLALNECHRCESKLHFSFFFFFHGVVHYSNSPESTDNALFLILCYWLRETLVKGNIPEGFVSTRIGSLLHCTCFVLISYLYSHLVSTVREDNFFFHSHS